MANHSERFPLVVASGTVEAVAEFGVKDVDITKLRDELKTIVEILGQVFTNPLGLPLKTLEVDLTITAEGSVSFLGTGGKLTGEGSIKLSFERPTTE
jgi:hypothetical protein